MEQPPCIVEASMQMRTQDKPRHAQAHIVISAGGISPTDCMPPGPYEAIMSNLQVYLLMCLRLPWLGCLHICVGSGQADNGRETAHS